MQERIWNKAGMPNTTFDLAEKDRPRLAPSLPVDPFTGKPQKVDIHTQKVKFDCGGSCAYSMAGDYIRFGQMLLNGGSLEGKRVLGPQTVAFMTSNHLHKDIKKIMSAVQSQGALAMDLAWVLPYVQIEGYLQSMVMLATLLGLALMERSSGLTLKSKWL